MAIADLLTAPAPNHISSVSDCRVDVARQARHMLRTMSAERKPAKPHVVVQLVQLCLAIPPLLFFSHHHRHRLSSRQATELFNTPGSLPQCICASNISLCKLGRQDESRQHSWLLF